MPANDSGSTNTMTPWRGVSLLANSMVLFYQSPGSLAPARPFAKSLRFAVTAAVLWITIGYGHREHLAASPAQPATQSATLRSAGAAKGVILGAAAAPSLLGEVEYASTLGGEFAQLEPENQLKFGPIHPRPGNASAAYDFSPADQLVSFAKQHDMTVRGHCFVWHQQVAGWVTTGIANHTYGAVALHEILYDHILTVAGHYAGKVWAWDVVNEAFNYDGTLRSTIWYDAPGIGFAGKRTAYIEQAFGWAHAADPAAKLFYNDYDAEEINDKSNAIYAMAKDFKSRGVPLDGIGFQMHIKLPFNDPKILISFASNLKRFSDLGMEIHITELDIALDSADPTALAAQGTLYGKITEVCLQTPTCRILQTWGFTDKYSWIPRYSHGKQGWALPFDADYKKKPAYESMLEALQAP
jgi:endo-1,4-beta-xylanase